LHGIVIQLELPIVDHLPSSQGMHEVIDDPPAIGKYVPEGQEIQEELLLLDE
jgi:hypothetical protein